MQLTAHDILGVAPVATSDEIKRAYFTLAKRYHPDVCKAPDAHARMKNINLAYQAIQLCGSMFGLPIQRHRWFASSHLLFAPGPCRHVKGFYNPVGGKIRGYGTFASDTTYDCSDGWTRRREGYYPKSVGAQAMDINWMTIPELCQAIPPAYTRYIGTQLLRMLGMEEQAS